MERKAFYSVMWYLPGCLPDGDGPIPIFGSYKAAAEYLADELDGFGDGFDEGEEYGDRFEAMAQEVRESIDEEAKGYIGEGPDNYLYSIEETEPKGTFRAWERETVPTEEDSGVTLAYSGGGDDEPTAEEAREEVQSIVGSNLEVADGETAYAIVESYRLDEAERELRESGYALDLSEFPTMRETLGDLSELDTFKVQDYGLGLGLYSTWDNEEERRKALSELRGGSISYGSIDSVDGDGEGADMVTQRNLVGSDYSGGALVRSNVEEVRKLLDEEDSSLRVDTYGGYGTDGVCILLDFRTTREAAERLSEVLQGLQDYPCVDEEAMSYKEHEEETEAWERFGADDFKRALEKWYSLDVDGDDEILGELFRQRADIANSNGGPGVIHEETGPYFLVDEVSKETPASLVAFLELFELDTIEALLIGMDDSDEGRRILRVLQTGKALRLYVLPALARGFVEEAKARGNGAEKGSKAWETLQAHSVQSAREMILRAGFDEGDVSEGIDSRAWECSAQRSVSVTFHRYVFSPGSLRCTTREAKIELDPQRGYLYGPDVEEALSPLFGEPESTEPTESTESTEA